MTRYQPRAVVVYSGDNDLTRGTSVDELLSDVEAFLRQVRRGRPELPVLVLSIKPSPARMAHWSQMQEANRRMEEHCGESESLTFVDLASPLFGEDGTLRSELFLADGIHLNAQGYGLWTPLIRAALASALDSAEVDASRAEGDKIGE